MIRIQFRFFFITVAPGTKFSFAVGWRSSNSALTEEEIRLRTMAENWLKDGLTLLGVGSKTSAGYGLFFSEHGAEVSKKIEEKESLPPIPSAPIIQKQGRISSIRPDLKSGRVQDDNGVEYTFNTEVLSPKGWTPARRTPVKFDIQGERVIRITK